MKVVFFTRQGAAGERGGDYLSLDCTVRELERLGVECTVPDDPTLDLTAFDIVHIHNLDVPVSALNYMIEARAQSKRVVTTPIYWRHTYWEEEAARNLETRPPFAASANDEQNDAARGAIGQMAGRTIPSRRRPVYPHCFRDCLREIAFRSGPFGSRFWIAGWKNLRDAKWS